ncbi:helix-turn-helix domain-containing protein [Trichocoleus sp. FACHB-90]|uniref:helix-turn-helix domain-containing protein n=1 Tax=Cyanophyceae TaxID=3028117 RepID=UPI001687AD6C|nr:helix-turn-helix domain-containing protein [Trichocoleus sp. FACHB-90]MBD1926309.1 helix-turn-helix domain-containing protein [Trichocoleus sp. FACHB-90]
MALQSAYGIGITESPTIEISQEVLRSILSRIEAELYSSEVYNRSLAGLQTILGEAAGNAQIMVKAVGREAIRLAFQQFAKTYKVVPVAPTEISNNQQEQQLSSPSSAVTEELSSCPVETLLDSNNLTTFQPDNLTTPTDNQQPTINNKSNNSPANSEEALPPLSSSSIDPIFPKPTKKLSKAQLAAQMAAQEREERLRQIGQELRQARHAQSLTMRQLHNLTLVPPHHIQALEIGRLDQLPEDIYVRGFIRRMGEALGLDGAAMAASLPAPDPVKTVVPSWYRPASASVFQLSTLHLYVGYAALVAGAVGGLAVTSNQSQSSATVEPLPDVPSNPSVSESQQIAKPAKPGLKLGKKGVAVGNDIAPPEAISSN